MELIALVVRSDKPSVSALMRRAQPMVVRDEVIKSEGLDPLGQVADGGGVHSDLSGRENRAKSHQGADRQISSSMASGFCASTQVPVEGSIKTFDGLNREPVGLHGKDRTAPKGAIVEEQGRAERSSKRRDWDRTVRLARRSLLSA